MKTITIEIARFIIVSWTIVGNSSTISEEAVMLNPDRMLTDDEIKDLGIARLNVIRTFNMSRNVGMFRSHVINYCPKLSKAQTSGKSDLIDYGDENERETNFNGLQA